MKSILYDYDWLLDVYVKEKEDEAEEKATQKIANRLQERGMNMREIAELVDMDEKVVREWLSNNH